ncbi:MAG: exodeoxyribonuclease VII large subunit [Candidatus Cloacimonetes bacterium]|nr:exodeoxyribonuclease VII large subunit [Candidatus Cloacimonadota bacterium]
MENDFNDNIFSVSEITAHVKNIVESTIPPLLVTGEISNYILHSSGHIYFSLKDARSTIKCVFFRGSNINLNFDPRNGDKVICSGKLTVYERGGNYQINIFNMYPAGIGELQIKFEELKRKLQSEGLFDEIHKKPLPRFPENIGLITSADGAALQDIKNVIARRFPVNVQLYAVSVQGKNTPAEVVSGISFFNAGRSVELIIIARGGGSQEDLFWFNSVEIARAIFDSEIPIITGIGHEIDFTIADFVADLRAPTPSAAAELAVPDKDELLATLSSFRKNFNSIVKNNLNEKRVQLNSQEKRLSAFHPKLVIQQFHKRLDESKLKLTGLRSVFTELKHKMSELEALLNTTTEKEYRRYLLEKSRFLSSSMHKLNTLTETNLSGKKTETELLKTKLVQLSPYEALKRGYSILKKENRIVSSVKKLTINDKIETILKDGKCICNIEEISESQF